MDEAELGLFQVKWKAPYFLDWVCMSCIRICLSKGNISSFCKVTPFAWFSSGEPLPALSISESTPEEWTHLMTNQSSLTYCAVFFLPQALVQYQCDTTLELTKRQLARFVMEMAEEGNKWVLAYPPCFYCFCSRVWILSVFGLFTVYISSLIFV